MVDPNIYWKVGDLVKKLIMNVDRTYSLSLRSI